MRNFSAQRKAKATGSVGGGISGSGGAEMRSLTGGIHAGVEPTAEEISTVL